MATGPEIWQALRHALFALLRDDAPAATQATSCKSAWCRKPKRLDGLPSHRPTTPTSTPRSTTPATSVAWPAPTDPLTDNFQWLPIAYHGRASSVVHQRHAVHRPMGQAMPPVPSAPRTGLRAARLRAGAGHLHWARATPSGQPVPLAAGRRPDLRHVPAQRLVGARPPVLGDGPLGPFLGKNFCTSVSPWIVTLEALAPFRVTAVEPAPTTRNRWPTWTVSRQPLARRAGHPARGAGAERGTPGAGPGRRASRPPASATSTGAWRRW
jgi:fumarylacetoacetase